MKTVEKIVNPVKRAGEQSPGKIYSDKLKVRARREWRGVKDTLYDYTRWLYLSPFWAASSSSRATSRASSAIAG